MMKAVDVQHDPERPVIEAIQGGDSHAMAELIRRQGWWVRGVIFGATGRLDEVDDVAQRVWMQVWREAKRLEDPGRWRVWLYRIARNAAADAGRSKRRRRRLLGQLRDRARTRQGFEAGPDQKLLAGESRQAMLEAIASLPALYREPFVLRHLQDWSYRQIGEALALPTDTVETRLVRARRLLRQRLAGNTHITLRDRATPRSASGRAGYKPAALLSRMSAHGDIGWPFSPRRRGGTARDKEQRTLRRSETDRRKP